MGHVRRLALIALVLTPHLLSACAGSDKPVSLAPPKRALKADDYKRELKRWTRFTSILRQLDTTLRLHATLRGPAFDAALIAKKTKLFGLDAPRVAKLKEAAQKRASESISLIVVAATHDIAWNDFDRKSSHWRIFLQNDAGEQLDPLQVKKLRRITETDRTLLPQLENFFERYDLSFPRALPDGRPFIRSDAKQISLHVRGALGSANLRWELR
ncbi:MAG: hypothetical protein JRH20_06530 [Deltaproteobacteria bacterium]|nr:hypothetical protein [Deltaproteobacteria bacterium]